MKKAELLARIEALENRILWIEACRPASKEPVITVTGPDGMSRQSAAQLGASIAKQLATARNRWQ